MSASNQRTAMGRPWANSPTMIVRGAKLDQTAKPPKANILCVPPMSGVPGAVGQEQGPVRPIRKFRDTKFAASHRNQRI